MSLPTVSIMVLNLDTNHISTLAKNKELVDPLLRHGDAALSMSWMMLVELSSPLFARRADVRALLNDIPVVYANPREELYYEECAFACGVLFPEWARPPIQVFVKDMHHWGEEPPPRGSTILDLFDYFVDNALMREHIMDPARHGAALANSTKEKAAIATDPLSHVAANLREHLAAMRQHRADYAGGIPAEQIIRRLGGDKRLPTMFPMLAVHQRLLLMQLRNPLERTTANDVFDEYLASYAPYASVTAVDGATYQRYVDAKLPHVERVTRDVRKVASIMELVRNGDFQPVQSAAAAIAS
jgi:hypothetical protein